MASINQREGVSEATISVIIPTRNEAALIESTLARLHAAGVDEVIVVDGASEDGTVQRAAHAGATVVRTDPGRGGQLRAGAESARGDILLFLHADTSLPEDFVEQVHETLGRPRVVGGAFRLSIDSPRRIFRMIEWGVHLRSTWFKRCWGDQALFAWTDAYHAAGGFADIPLMEDVEFIRALRKTGRIGIAPGVVRTSARRWEQNGVLRTTLTNLLCLAAVTVGIRYARIASLRTRLAGRGEDVNYSTGSSTAVIGPFERESSGSAPKA